MMKRPQRSREGGFTLLEILVALTVTVIGLLGVMMMQAATIRSNRESQMFTRASNFAEEVMEKTRGLTVAQLQGGMTFSPMTFNNTTYTVAATAVDMADSTNLTMVTVTVSYDEENDTTSSDDRKSIVQMIRTKTEAL